MSYNNDINDNTSISHKLFTNFFFQQTNNNQCDRRPANDQRFGNTDVG